MASTDARPLPLKNTAYRVTFPILDADGDLVTGAAGLDSEISKDGGTFADCTNEATEIATSSGMYYLDLTSTEMNADTVALIVKTSTSGAKTTPIVLYPVEGGDIDVDVTYVNGSAVSTSSAQLGVNVVNAAGTAWGSGAITAASIATGAITSAKFAAGAIDAAAIAADAIGSSELAATAVAEIADAVWDELQADHTGATTMGGSLAEAGADNSDVVAQAVWDLDTTGHEIAGTFGEAMSNAGGGSSPADIADAVWDEATAGHVAAGSAGLALAYARDGSAVNGSTTAADNLKKWFDGTGYAAAASTVGTATVVTNTVNANVTNVGGDSNVYAAMVALFKTAVIGTVVSGTNTTTVISTGLSSSVNDFYKGKMLVVTSGSLAKQGGKLVTAYDGATKRLTVEALTGALSAGDTFVLVG